MLTTSFPMEPMAWPAGKTLTVTSAVGKNNRGFSLFELVLVLLLLGVSMAIVLTEHQHGLQDREVRNSALGLAAASRELRSRALADGVPQRLVSELAAAQLSRRARPAKSTCRQKSDSFRWTAARAWIAI